MSKVSRDLCFQPIVLASAVCCAAGAGGQTLTPSQPAPSTYDRVWAGLTEWYKSESNPVVQQLYRGGVYSSGAMNREFGEFTGDYFTLGLVGYDFANVFAVKEAVLTGNYVYQHPDRDNTFTRPLKHVRSAHFKLEAGKWGLAADVSDADGYLGQSDMWAFMAMPFFNMTDRVQAVRYTYIESENSNGIAFGTYENRVVPGRGDEYNEMYVGVNYYFYGHNLKLQTGLQWADMNDRANDGGEYTGISWTTGVRVGW